MVRTSFNAPFLQLIWFANLVHFSHRYTTSINTFQFILILVGKLFSLLLLFIFVTFYIHESQLFQVNRSEMGEEKTGDDERETSLYSSFSYYCDIYFEFISDTRFISFHFTWAQLNSTHHHHTIVYYTPNIYFYSYFVFQCCLPCFRHTYDPNLMVDEHWTIQNF